MICDIYLQPINDLQKTFLTLADALNDNNGSTIEGLKTEEEGVSTKVINQNQTDLPH
jgi:hypothetical protein